MTRYVLNRLLSGLVTLFSAGFYLVSLGLKDAAFRGSERSRSGWARLVRARSGI